MRDKIEKILALQGCEGYDAIGEIISLFSTELKDAAKWRKVEEIAKRNWYDGYPCEGCPVANCCDGSDSLCGQAESLVGALSEGKEEKCLT
jgi:hypothetical protein